MKILQPVQNISQKQILFKIKWGQQRQIQEFSTSISIYWTSSSHIYNTENDRYTLSSILTYDTSLHTASKTDLFNVGCDLFNVGCPTWGILWIMRLKELSFHVVKILF